MDKIAAQNDLDSLERKLTKLLMGRRNNDDYQSLSLWGTMEANVVAKKFMIEVIRSIDLMIYAGDKAKSERAEFDNPVKSANTSTQADEQS